MYAPFSSNSGDPMKEVIALSACGANELLPQTPDLPADIFTACLTTPIKVRRAGQGGAGGGAAGRQGEEWHGGWGTAGQGAAAGQGGGARSAGAAAMGGGLSMNNSERVLRKRNYYKP